MLQVNPDGEEFERPLGFRVELSYVGVLQRFV